MLAGSRATSFGYLESSVFFCLQDYRFVVGALKATVKQPGRLGAPFSSCTLNAPLTISIALPHTGLGTSWMLGSEKFHGCHDRSVPDLTDDSLSSGQARRLSRRAKLLSCAHFSKGSRMHALFALRRYFHLEISRVVFVVQLLAYLGTRRRRAYRAAVSQVIESSCFDVDGADLRPGDSIRRAAPGGKCKS